MSKLRKTQEVYDACMSVGIEGHVIDNYPKWYIKQLVKAFREENKA